MSDPQPIGTLLEQAWSYAGLGFEIFPVGPLAEQRKRPLSQHGHKDATTDLDQIEAWWRKWPNALIGCRISPHHLLLDIDPRHGGKAVWRALRDEMPAIRTRTHLSGRGDGGGHVWFQRPADKLTATKLDAWAKERGLGKVVKGRHTSGIDLLRHEHRYTILPPSKHPDTGEPYYWAAGRGLAMEPAPMPALLAELVTADALPEPSEPTGPRFRDPDSIADWYSSTHGFGPLLTAEGWTLVAGDGESDGSCWRHPEATTAVSATVRHGCLFVYSTSTAFEPTGPGEVHGYTPFRAFAALHHDGDLKAAGRAARETRQGKPDGVNQKMTPEGPQPIDWVELFSEDQPAEEWLFIDVLARGRGHAVYAQHKQGKSLFLFWCAVELARRDDVDVIYLDYEMTRSDVRERAEDMGCGTQTDLGRLHYYLLPFMAPLDTREGAGTLNALVDRHERPDKGLLVVIDTTSRAVEGEENSADTVRAFYRWTGSTLKRRGVTWVRLDHAGKDQGKKQRGSSAKGDDVDVVWELVRTDDGVALKCQAARMSWVKEKVSFKRHDEPLRYEPIDTGWPQGTKEVASVLDELEVPLDASVRGAVAALRAAERGRKREVVAAALRWRREPQVQIVPDLGGTRASATGNTTPQRGGNSVPPSVGEHFPAGFVDPDSPDFDPELYGPDGEPWCRPDGKGGCLNASRCRNPSHRGPVTEDDL